MATRLPLALIDQAGNDRLDGFDTATASANTRLDAIELDTGKIDAIERRIGLNFLNDAVNVGVTVMGATDAFVDEFHDESGIASGWVADQDNEAMTDLFSGSTTSTVEVDGTEEVAQSFIFTSTSPLVGVTISVNDDGTTYPVDGDVYTMTIETDNAGAPSGTSIGSLTTEPVDANSNHDMGTMFAAADPIIPPDTTSTFWARITRTSGTGRLRVNFSSSVGYASGNVWRTTGGADAGNDFTTFRLLHHTGGVVMRGTPTAAYEATSDYLTNASGGYGLGSTTTGWSNQSRTNSNANILLWPELVPGKTVKSIWLYNNGTTAGDGGTNTVAYVMRWNGWGVAATVMASLSQSIGTSGWKEFAINYTIPNDSNRYCLGIYFPHHWSSNTMTETAAAGYYAWAGETILNGGASITSTGLTADASGVLPPFWVEYEGVTTVQNCTFRSLPVAADAAPDTVRLIALYDDISTTATINTDIIFEVSRDGGTTWTAATMVNEGDYTGTIDILASGATDISAQPSGTSMLVRARTLNTKEQRVHGWWLQWS
jgi:hypothetical protein